MPYTAAAHIAQAVCSGMAESKYDDGYSSDQEEKQLVLGEEDDEDGDAGPDHHHTLSLACSIAVKSEVLCVAFSYDGRWAVYRGG